MAASCTDRVVVFDFDGTLADTWRDIETALNRTLVEANLAPVGGPDVRSWIGHGALALLDRAVPQAQRTPQRLDALYQAFRVHYDRCCLDTTELYPGIDACLDALSDLTLAIASNKPANFLEPIVEGLGLKGRFAGVFGGDALPVRKPDPELLPHVLRAIDAEPRQVWMVGDSAIDVQTGRAAGARTIGCAWGLRTRQELRDAGVEHLVERPDEIPFAVLEDV